YMGDGLMILFPGEVESGIRSAISILEGVKAFNKNLITQGKESIRVGIGINYGEVAFGIIGSEYRKSGNVISDTVNLASRMEGLTKYYGSTVIISEYIYKKIKNESSYPIRYLDRVRAKGKTKPVRIYELITEEEKDKLEAIEDFKRGIYYYLAGKFDKSLKIFEDLNNLYKNDKAVEIYRQRIEEILKNGTEENWDGTFDHLSK
ncbi:MAG: adenylate/guanylate cyclase domain-containing protein, partial [Leptospiraceae bacterium]|nr:adenylate/guanylate cyclase domain-containing protein [Leptospiraceae bacterium]